MEIGERQAAIMLKFGDTEDLAKLGISIKA